MKLEEITIILPCHSLEDFPVYHQGDDADGLLAAWSALWHPALVAAAGAAPGWGRADDPPESFAGRLFVIPRISQQELPAGWAERAASEGAVVLRKLNRRDQIVAQALAELDGQAFAVDEALAADFMALGFCYLQVELLTRQMRYSSHIDQVYLQNETVAGATAAVRGDEEAARNHLANCFDILAQARDQFYPVDSYLVDLTLVAPTTMGQALRDQLALPAPTNLLMPAELVEQMAKNEPETLAAVRQALERGTASIIGGEYGESELALLPPERVLDEFHRGREVYLKYLGQAPRVYGRRRFGLTPLLPQVLCKLGFTGALHATFDGGRFPLGEQSKVRWEGLDGSAIDTLANRPLDATRADSFLNLSHRLGDAMDHDHVATLCFTHWPGDASPWYDALRRVAGFCPALGKFKTLDDYFSSTDMPHMLAKFDADAYQSPYLADAVAGGADDSISRYTAQYDQQARRYAVGALSLMAKLAGGQSDAGPDASTSVADATGKLAEALEPLAGGSPSGFLVANPCSFSRRVPVELEPLLPAPEVGEHIVAVGEMSGKTQAVVEVPALGFAWVGPGAGTQRGRKGKTPPLAEANRLRNEHMEVTINPTTGALQSLHLHQVRGNRLSQQVAFRAPSTRPPGVMAAGPVTAEPYSVMAADSIDTTCSMALGQVVARGRLLDKQGAVLAGFEQRFQLWRGSRLLHVQVTLDPQSQPGKDPWDSYYAARFAWPAAGAEMFRSIGGCAHPTSARRLEAPEVVEIRHEAHRTAIVTGGLPFHRRSGERMLDTILLVRGERARVFRLAIGVDLAHPLQAAAEFLSPADALVVPASRPAASPTGWLFHVGSRNVVATHWEPLYDEGREVGFRARLLETEGRAGRVALHAAKPVASALQTDFNGESLCDLPMEEGKIFIDFAQHEWVQVDARWK